MNSFVVACGVTAIVIAVSCLSAYAFARLKFPGREGLLLTYLSTLMIPQVMLVIPLFLIVSKFGWINTYHGMILPVAFSSFGTFLLRQFILGIPKDLDEAAMMDGASRLRILVTVIVPLAMPAIGLLSLFTFIAQWKSFLWPLIATSGVEKPRCRSASPCSRHSRAPHGTTSWPVRRSPCCRVSSWPSCCRG